MATSEHDHWRMNYHEAAIFLEEGRNNEKFDSHPTHPSALPAYLLVHNSWYYGLDLATSILLLLLALVESPAVQLFEVKQHILSLLYYILFVINCLVASGSTWNTRTSGISNNWN